MVDPNSEEESLADSLISIVVEADSELICLIHKFGGSSLSESQIELCIKKAVERSKQIKSLIVNSFNKINMVKDS